MMRRTAFALAVALSAACLSGGPAAAQAPFANDNAELAGRASVVDGDTLDLRGVRIRIHGIDAPESSQRCLDAAGSSYACGNAAARHLDGLLMDRTVFCSPNGRSYDRIVAVCTVDGRDVGGAMTAAGWAIDVPKYSRGRYANDEIAARAAGLGIWQGDFEDPADYRRSHPRGGFR